MMIMAYANGGEGNWHMMDWWHMGPYGWYGGILMWILLLGLIGLAIYLVIRSTQTRGSSGEETPLQILKRRYAKGEISREEYERMKRDLEG
jgi:putative membrane protein